MAFKISNFDLKNKPLKVLTWKLIRDIQDNSMWKLPNL